MADADFSVKAIISAQTSQFEKGMKNAQASVNSLSSSISNITNLVKKAFAFTGVAVGTKAIVDFGKSCVQSANQAVKTFNILDNTIKATGADAWTSIGELENASKSLSDSTNYSVTEIQKMQSVLLGFTNITGEAFDGASEAVLDMATVMGMDLTSAVQTVGKALDDPITGLDSLRRQGFKFTDEQKAELAQLVKNGKQYEAQKIILDTLATSYGGASRAGQDSFAEQRHAVENFRDTLGTKLIPVMQVFAENNSKMLNSLTDVISKMDFTPVINVVTNLKKIFSETFNTISGYLRNVSDYVSDFISRFNFKPIISVLDTLIGVLSGVIYKFKEINSQKLEIFDKLKEALIDFSNSETFQNIVNFVNKIIDAVFFLWSEIQDIGMEIRDLVVNKVIEIWGKIKELFQNSQNALADSGQDIASWGDLFYDVLNNAFRIFQDFFGMVKALIHGDWTIAWEYAKLTVMRIADNILDIFSTIANAFPDLVNVFLKGWNWIIEQINKARKLFGQDPLDLAGAFESVDLSKSSGLEDKIKEAEDKIQELTGKSADITIQNLEGVSTKFAGFTQHALGEIGQLTEGVATNSEKQKQYFTGTFSSTEENGNSTYEKFSEWDSKLLQQRLEDLDEWSDEYHEVQLALIAEEKKKAEEADKTGAETEKINKYYNKQIEKENERAEKAKRTKVKETMKVVFSTMSNIAQKTIDVFKKIAATMKNIFTGVTNIVKNSCSRIVNFTKSLVSTVVSAFEKIFTFNPDEFLDNLLKIEDTILTFFVETLPTLPAFFESAFSSVIVLINQLISSIKWEDIQKILTSIVTTFTSYVPKITTGIIDLFSNLVTTLTTVFIENAPAVINSIGEMFGTIGKALPGIITNLTTAFDSVTNTIVGYFSQNKGMLDEIFDGVVKAIKENLPNLISDIVKIADLVIQTLPKIVEIITSGLNTLMIDIGTSLLSDFDKLSTDLINMIYSIVGSIKKLLEGDGLKVLLTGLSSLFVVLVNTIGSTIPEITDGIIKVLPDVMSGIMTSLFALIKNLTKLVRPMIDVIMELIDSVFQYLLSGEGLTTLIDLVVTVVTTLITDVIPKLVAIIIKNIPAFILFIPELIAKLLAGLVDGFIKTDWIGLVKDCFTGFINSIKSFFGIHSPSTVFADFGENMIKGLWEGIKGLAAWLWDNVSKSFTTLINNIGNLLKNIGSVISTAFDEMKTSVSNAFTTTKENVQIAWGVMGSWFNNIQRSIVSAFDNLRRTIPVAFETAKTNVTKAWENMGSWFGDVRTAIVNAFSNAGTYISETFTTAKTTVMKAWEGMTNWFVSIKNNIASTFTTLKGKVTTAFSDAKTNVQNAWNTMGTWFTTIKTNIVNAFSTAGTNISNVFNSAKTTIQNAWSGLTTWFSNLFNGIKTGISKIMSGVVAVVKAPINGVITALNAMINGLNKISFDIPNWVPALGGKKFGIQIPNIPALATGTNSAYKGLTLVGEAGPELVKFRGGEQVLNNRNTQKALEKAAGNTNNFNVTFNNMQDTTAFAMIQQLKQYNRQMAINGIL